MVIKVWLALLLMCTCVFAADKVEENQKAWERFQNLYSLPVLERKEDISKAADVILADMNNTYLLKFDETRTRIDVRKAANIIAYLDHATKDGLLEPIKLFQIAQAFDDHIRHYQNHDDRLKTSAENIPPNLFKAFDVEKLTKATDAARTTALANVKNAADYIEMLAGADLVWKSNYFLDAKGNVAVEKSLSGAETLEGVIVSLYRKKEKQYGASDKGKQALADWFRVWLLEHGPHLREAIEKSNLSGKGDGRIPHSDLEKLGRMFDILKKGYPKGVEEWEHEYQNWFHARNFLEDLVYRPYSKTDPRYLYYSCRRTARLIANRLSGGGRS